MEKVKIKTKNTGYCGEIFGYKFVDGEAKDVPLSHAEFMVKQFNVEIDKPVQPKQKPKTKPKAKPKAPATKKAE